VPLPGGKSFKIFIVFDADGGQEFSPDSTSTKLLVFGSIDRCVLLGNCDKIEQRNESISFGIRAIEKFG